MDLLEGENEILRLKPHILSRAWSYLFWTFCFLMTYLYATDAPVLNQIYDWAANHQYFSIPMKVLSLMPRSAAWAAILITPVFLTSLFRLEWGHLVRFVLILATAFAMRFFELGPGIEFQAICYISIGAILYLEVTRWSTQYVITNQRIILEHKGWKNTTRTLFYSKINDLVLSQNFWGKIFRYGSVIPITASGLGLGASESSVQMGAMGGSGVLSAKLEGGMAKSTQEAAETHEYAIFCVPNPQKAYNIILQGMQRKEA